MVGVEIPIEQRLIIAQKHYPLGSVTGYWVSKGRKLIQEYGKQDGRATRETDV